MKYTKTIRASKTTKSAHPVSASRAALRRRAVKADEEIIDEEIVDEAPVEEGEAEVYVDDAATELLFEAEDVAELIAEVTDAPVDVTVDDDTVIFTVGGNEFTVTPEGDEEIVEQSTKIRRSSKAVAASKAVKPAARKVAASRKVRK